jgi:hypothetical protein
VQVGRGDVVEISVVRLSKSLLRVEHELFSFASGVTTKYTIDDDTLPIPISFEVELTNLWPAVEALVATDLWVLRDEITHETDQHLLTYSLRMSSLALRLRSPDPARWALTALALGGACLEPHDTQRYLSVPCDALKSLGFTLRGELLRASRLATHTYSEQYYLEVLPGFPATAGQQCFLLVETEGGVRYVHGW